MKQVEVIERALRARKRNKEKILREGGQQALSHNKEDIRRIERALQRLSTGSYGSCVDCGAGIVKGRLEAIPEAERCIKCQIIFEKKLN